MQERGTQAENPGPLSVEGLRNDPTSLLNLNADDPLILKLEMLRLLEVGFEPVEIRRAFNLESEAHLHEMLAQVRAEGTSTLVSHWAGSTEERPAGFWGLDTMGQICAAANRVFYERGYHGATLRDIAEVVGIRAASIYNYFPTKEALLHHVMMETLSKLREQVDTTLAATPDDPTKRISTFIMEHIRFHIEHAQEAAVADNELRALSAEKRVSVVALRDSYEEILRDLLQQGVQKGVFAEAHVKLTSLAILTMCTSVAVWYRPDGPMSTNDVATAYTRLVLHMIGAGEVEEAGKQGTWDAKAVSAPRRRVQGDRLVEAASLAQRVLDGERRALARAISLVESGRAGDAEILAALYPHTGNAHRVGVTGPPGSGKSTLVNALALAMRQRGLRLGIVAVDPTSPFTGGAILGDRIRMGDLVGDPGIFIRSMATRGSLGGLARATSGVIEVLDAAGFDVVIVETVGAGQSEVGIAQTVHTTIVIEVPGLGDDIQAIKAGILEVADVLVVNKADQPQAENTFRALRAMLDVGAPHSGAAGHHAPRAMLAGEDDGKGVEKLSDKGWKIPILKTIASEGQGVEALLDAVQAHRAYLVEGGRLAALARARVASELETLLREALLAELADSLGPQEIERTIDEVLARRLDPHSAVDGLVRLARRSRRGKGRRSRAGVQAQPAETD